MLSLWQSLRPLVTNPARGVKEHKDVYSVTINALAPVTYGNGSTTTPKNQAYTNTLYAQGDYRFDGVSKTFLVTCVVMMNGVDVTGSVFSVDERSNDMAYINIPEVTGPIEITLEIG